MSAQPTGSAPAQADDGALSTEQVLVEEAIAIDPDITHPYLVELASSTLSPAHGKRDQKLGVGGDLADDAVCARTAKAQHSLYGALNSLDRAALCLSGGGIRSAAFSLGVIQALAAHPRPERLRGLFETDTTPSRRAEEHAPQSPQAHAGEHDQKRDQKRDQEHAKGHARAHAQVADARVPPEPSSHAGRESRLHAPENTIDDPACSLLAHVHYLSTVSGGGYIGSWLSVWRNRVGFATLRDNLVGRPCGPDVEPGTMTWLRAYSNYLTPSLGALSGDTWAGVAISLRNLLLNWLVIAPAVCVVILLLKIVATVSIGIATYPQNYRMVALFAVLAIVPLIIALRFTTRNRPSRRADDTRDKIGRRLGVVQGTFIGVGLVPATLAAGGFIQLGASNSGLMLVDGHSKWLVAIATALATAVIYAVSWILACPNRSAWRDFLVWTASGLVYGALLGAGAYLYHLPPVENLWIFNDLLLPMMLGVPWILLSQMISDMIFVGLSSYEANSDDDREWLGRAGGWYLVTALGWFAVTFLVFAGSLAVDDFSHHFRTWIAPLGGVGGLVTAIVGKSSLSQGTEQQSKGSKPLSTGIILAIAAPLFAAALIVSLSAALDQLLLDDSLVALLRTPNRYIFAPGWWRLAVPISLGLVLTGVIVWLASRRFDIKRLAVLSIAVPIIAVVAIVLAALILNAALGPALIVLGRAGPSDIHNDNWWEIVVPLLLGIAIIGVIARIALKHDRIDIRRIGVIAGAVLLAWPAGILFVAGAIAMLATQLGVTLHHQALDMFKPGWFELFAPLIVGCGIAGTVAWIASYNININRFSLHAIYRNRLVRAFLGASRPKRNPDAFTGFDPDDNPPMHTLWPKPDHEGKWPARKPADWRPFHVINMALNVVSTRRLSWQERKAEAFTVSPLHSGSACKAFRRSQDYGGAGGISLGTAMAISGAAASPNMGYNSSPGVTFLLALFNVRLGWWFGNPGREGEKTFRLEGPTLALQPLVEETFGLTTDERPYVYLSDGGHFENLGIYEMVRRRCRYIIAVDAGADPNYGFEDLGNAVRKISIDLGVTIRFHGLDKLTKRNREEPDVGAGHPYHAIGEINYPAADGGGNLGIILYIKPGYHGVENAGVRAYAIANPTFPHQGTIDQFFSESQFESYRALGFEIADDLLDCVLAKLGHGKANGLEEIFDQLRKDAQEADKEGRSSAARMRRAVQEAAPATGARETRQDAG